MAMLPVRPFVKSQEDYEVAVACHDLELSVGVFDRQSGRQYEGALRISTSD